MYVHAFNLFLRKVVMFSDTMSTTCSEVRLNVNESEEIKSAEPEPNGEKIGDTIFLDFWRKGL